MSNSCKEYHVEQAKREAADDSQSGHSPSNSSARESNRTGNDGTTSNKSDTDSVAEVMANKPKMIRRSKLFMLSLIAIAATIIATVAYVTTRNHDVSNFETQYYNLASSVVDSSTQEAKRMFAAVYSFGNKISTLTDAANMPWPNITLSDFEVLGFKNNELSKAIQITFSPLVTVENRAQWEEYSVANQGWLAQSLQLQDQFPVIDQRRRHLADSVVVVPPIPTQIWSYDVDGKPVAEIGGGVDFGPGNYAPVWQQSPAPTDPSIINYDLLSNTDVAAVYKTMWETKLPIVSPVLDLQFLYSSAVDYNSSSSDPTSFLLSPVYPYLPSQHRALRRDDLVGFLVAVIPWDSYFAGLLPTGINGMIIVMNTTCGDVFSYELNGPTPVYLGKGDYHDSRFSGMRVSAHLDDFLPHNFSDPEFCAYTMNIYPSSTLQSKYISVKPAVYTTVVLLLFFCTAVVFEMYDYLVRRRHAKVADSFKRTTKIISTMFPSTVRDRLLKENDDKEDATKRKRGNNKQVSAHAKAQLKSFLSEDKPGEASKAEADRTQSFESKPIADFFPECTVCYADIVGFTSWSSVREPSQVFTLLETLYNAFDRVAKRRRVFKVETIGDCYVAVTGIPNQRNDHALLMCRFARDCLHEMHVLTKKLEVTLGPGTGDLSMRFGLHSGPVTAGVLRGENCRFQLFGETVEHVSKMESKGAPNRVHLSQQTADFLTAAGKSNWFEARPDPITLDSETVQTYWLKPRGALSDSRHGNGDNSSAGGSSGGFSQSETSQMIYQAFDAQTQRLVEWNMDVMSRLLKKVVARRLSRETYRIEGIQEECMESLAMAENDRTVLDEVVEIIHLPEFDGSGIKKELDVDAVELPFDVLQQLQDYITIIATMYKNNPFHNFEHASHVTMSVVKLLSRISTPELHEHEMGDEQKIASSMHDLTYGITSDPLTQFACVFAALIHDVDHHGVPNMQLVKENSYLASRYGGKSVLEQNSVDVAWALLMDLSFQDLRAAIYRNAEEKKRFRQLVVNSVMATDIIDKDLKALRNNRWDKAFQESSPEDASLKDTVDRKATIVIEHLIQASDIAHTMQHWHIYRKWNERLFHEMYNAYKAGRAEKDPSEFWYNGEIGFFDFYIIPLAKKLKDCGVFGVSSDEYLNYAEKNRKEWEAKGREVVASMVEKYASQLLKHEVRLDELEGNEPVNLRSCLLPEDKSCDARMPSKDSMAEDLEAKDLKDGAEVDDKKVVVVKRLIPSSLHGLLDASFASSCDLSDSEPSFSP